MSEGTDVCRIGGGPDILFPAHQNDLNTIFSVGRQSPLDDLAGRIVAAHGVYNDFHGTPSFLFLCCLCLYRKMPVRRTSGEWHAELPQNLLPEAVNDFKAPLAQHRIFISLAFSFRTIISSRKIA